MQIRIPTHRQNVMIPSMMRPQQQYPLRHPVTLEMIYQHQCEMREEAQDHQEEARAYMEETMPTWPAMMIIFVRLHVPLPPSLAISIKQPAKPLDGDEDAPPP